MKVFQVILLSAVVLAAFSIHESASMWATVFMNKSGKRRMDSQQKQVGEPRS